MSCRRYQNELRDAALGAPASAGLQAHLRACASCRAAWEEERRLGLRIDEQLGRALDVTPSPGFLPRLRLRLDSEAESRRPSMPRWLVPALATLVVLGTIVPLLWKAPSPRERDPALVARTEPPSPPVTPEATGSPSPPRPEARGPRRAPPRPAPEPDVLVPPGGDADFRRFVALLGPDQVETVLLQAEAAGTVTADEIAIPPLEVKPLTLDE